MNNDYFRYYKPKLFLPFIAIISTAIGSIMNYLPLLINNSFIITPYYQYPSTVVVVGGFLTLINLYLWKIRPFSWLFWIDDISGRYEGKIEFLWNNEEREKECVIEIEQNASIIKVNSYFDNKQGSEKTSSKSITSSIISDELGNLTLVFNYENHGNIVKKLPSHKGTNILEIKKNNEGYFLEGIYYTSKEPQTKGQMKVSYISKKLKKEF